MSTDELAAKSPDERETLTRTFEVDLSEGDGRTLDARIVPYNVPAIVSDPPHFRPYQETFLPRSVTNTADRVKIWMNFEHQQGLQGIIGHGIQLDDKPDALYGSFRIHDNPDGEKALGLVREGILTGLSVEFVPLKSQKIANGWARERVHIDKVSLCMADKSAYKQAAVLAVRTEPVEAIMVPEFPGELLERLTALGAEPLQRMSISKRPWDGSPSRFTDEEYQRSCLIDRGGDAPPKERCSLPVLEPNGDLNVNALGPAAAALAGARTPLAGVSREQKAAAARKLVRYYRAAQQEPPASLTLLAKS